MFTDPAVITIAGAAKSLIRINQDGYSSEYLLRTSTEEFRLFVRNSSRYDKKRGAQIDRHNFELIHSTFATTAGVLPRTRKTYAVIEFEQGDTQQTMIDDSVGLLNYLTASSGANIAKAMNFES